MMMDKKQSPMHLQVAKLLIEQLKAGTAPWQKPWSAPDKRLEMMPYNFQSGKRYRGINAIHLLLSDRGDPRWMTFKQAEASGLRVARGEKGTLIQFVKTHERKKLRDDQGKQVYNELGEPIMEMVSLPRPIISNAWVFNAEQIQNMPEMSLPTSHLSWDPIERAEMLISNSGADISHQYIDEAYYHIRYDAIVVPKAEQFEHAKGYYATVMHELAHWTGHPSRLDRSKFFQNGLHQYAREELRAEIASMIIGAELGIGNDHGQHVAYLQGWIDILQDNPLEILTASVDAEKIFSFLSSLERKQELTMNVTKEMGEALKSNKSYLSTGDTIHYKGHTYLIQGHLKQGRLRVKQLPSAICFTLSGQDKLYNSLLAVKLNALQQQTSQPIAQSSALVLPTFPLTPKR
ncbi:Antirestriction protein ArdC [Pedobacter rhizosphaerae]|uniref:Antirestriction protein ArdC n=2 Tax=Pedobacter rhizosphaerae TaxID=390241 RepID=A0A1H9N549_9SPHI|nr:Antirestriction protein ArdC [Pedobacter rhizosphaerae]